MAKHGHRIGVGKMTKHGHSKGNSAFVLNKRAVDTVSIQGIEGERGVRQWKATCTGSSSPRGSTRPQAFMGASNRLLGPAIISWLSRVINESSWSSSHVTQKNYT